MSQLVSVYMTLLQMPARVQAKYMIPRDPGLQTAYRAAKLQRPKFKIHGVRAFGFVLRPAVLEERTYHGSALVI